MYIAFINKNTCLKIYLSKARLLTGVSAVVLVLTAGSGSSDEGEDDEGLHVAVVS